MEKDTLNLSEQTLNLLKTIKKLLKVKHKTLVLITGFIWTAVSFLLLIRAYSWLELFSPKIIIIVVIIGIIISFIKYRFIFLKTTKSNIKRIINLKGEKVSVFAFHTIKFYLLIVLMIGGGTLLRHLEFIPKYFLFPIYMGVGFAMLFSSFMYYYYFFNKNK